MLLLADFRAGSMRALARAISFVESGTGGPLIRELFPLAGRAITIGLTGPPGVGKSTICAALVRVARERELSVGVISVDPSSPFSHGALLGDRIRLTEHFTDADVFIRSMASRGHLGGLSGATADAVTLMDAFGKDVVIVETVGVGQSEIEIADVADTTVVALQPGSGDSIQVLKAGILEVADVFVVNKADHAMAPQMQREIRSMMEMLDFSGWEPALVATQALEGRGIVALWDAILEHRRYLEESGTIRDKRQAAFLRRVRALAAGTLERRIEREMAETSPVAADPYGAASAVLARMGIEETIDRLPSSAVAPGVRSLVKGL